MEKQIITIYNIAREVNVPMATVSRVVNGNPNIKPVTRKKVLGVIGRLDYRPNAVAHGLTSKKTTAVGIIIPDVSNTLFASLVRDIDGVTTMYRYNIILVNSDGSDQKEVTILNNLLAKQVDGTVSMGHRVTDDIRGEFSRSKTPVILAGLVGPDEQAGSVNIDYTETTEDATTTLAKNGSKKIAFVSGALINPISGQSRMRGCKEALAENDLSYNEGLVFESEYRSKVGINLAKRVCNSGAITAFVTDDELAISLLDGMLDTNVGVLGEFEIITSNNSLLAEVSRPRLSSITQPPYDISVVSMRLLTKLMNKEEIEEKTVILPCGVGQRSSTK